ncbi:hypothetical protein WJX79_009148 [Trebouxia sp. C0005]
MPIEYKRPSSVKQAQVFVGAPVKLYWKSSLGIDFAEGWYDAKVTKVHRVSGEGAHKLFFWIQYVDDEEDLEWDQVFNGAEMDQKTDIIGDWNSEALAFLGTLQHNPDLSKSASQMQMSQVGQSADPSQHHSQGSHCNAANTHGVSNESHSPPQANGFSHGSGSQSQANDGSRKLRLDNFQAGEESDNWEGPGPSQAVPPNKRRRIQSNDSKRDQRPSAEALHPRYNQVLQPAPGVGTSGQIKKIRLENFMCHDNLLIEFTPHVNFISGSNGSGKSASLQALQCCLGVKARDTGRATKAEQFIKTGCSHAVAAVSLWNTGGDALNPGLYGSSITIERRITKSSSTFSIKDAAGRKVGEGKSQVDEIIEHFNINAGNPAICMTQDTARSFAGKQSDEAKFQLYMEATHFAETIENLNDAEYRITQMLDILHNQGRQFRAKRAELQEIAQKVEDMRQVEQWEILHELYGKIIAWQQYYRISELLQEEQRRYGLMPGKLSEVTQKLSAAAEEYNRTDQEHQAQRQALQDFAPRMTQFEEQQRQQYAAARTALSAVRTAHQEVESGNADIAELEADKRSLQQSAEEMQQQLASNSQAAVDRHRSAIAVKERESEAASARASLTRQAVREADAAVDQATKATKAKERAQRECNARTQDLIGDLNRLRQSQQNPVTAFTPSGCTASTYSNFLARVAQASSAGRFHRAPVGPIGSLLTLTDDKWAVAVEIAIGRALSTFVVHDFNDQRTLNELARQSGVRSLSVYICNFDLPLQDIRAGRVRPVPEHLLTVMQVLSFPAEAGHVIQNALIIQHSIERLVLVDEQPQAMQLIRAQTGIQGPGGAVINRCFTRDGGQAYGRKMTETWIPSNRTPQARLSRNVAGQIAQVQADLSSAQTAAGAATREVEAARADDREVKQWRERAIREKQTAERAKNTADSQLDELNSQQADDPEGANAALRDTLNDIADKDLQIRDLQRQMAERDEALQTATAEDNRAKAAMSELLQQKEVLIRDNEACEAAISDVMDRKQHARQYVQYLTEKEQERHDAMVNAEKQLEQFRVQQDNLKRRALEMSTPEEEAAARAELCRTWEEDNWTAEQIQNCLQVDVLVDRLRKVEAQIAQKERVAGTDLATLKVQHHQLENQVAKLELKFTKVAQAHELLTDGVDRRKATSKRIRNLTEQQISQLFNMYLSKKGHRGSIKLLHDAEKLELKVDMDGGTSNRRSVVKDMKSLSGGERSYTSVCFIMALANVISAPFHCMDEFDVFMDAINRRVSLAALLEFAIQNSHVQLILLSPQDVSAVEEARLLAQKSLPLPNPEIFLKIVQMVHARAGADQ